MTTEIKHLETTLRLQRKVEFTLKVAIEISVDPSLLTKIERSERQQTKNSLRE